jgi:hypothetical protein
MRVGVGWHGGHCGHCPRPLEAFPSMAGCW